VHARRDDVCMPDPVLDAPDIRIVLERVGDRRRAQRMWPKTVEVDAGHACVSLQHAIDAVGCDRLTGAAGIVADWLEKRRRIVVTAASHLEVSRDCVGRCQVQGHVADFAAFALHPQMANAASFLQVNQVQCAQLSAAQPVVEQGGKDRAIA